MITDQDVEKLAKVFATKDDVNKLEEKMFKTFVTKEEFRDEFSKLPEIFATKYEFNELKGEVGIIRETAQGLALGMDKVLSKLDNLGHEYVALKMSDDRQNNQIQDLAVYTGYKFRG